MILTHILGGLGNQMFQYAAGRALSLRSATEFSLDISSFEGYTLHQGFELSSIFNINQPCLNEGQIKKILGWRRYCANLGGLKILPNWLVGSPFIIREPHFHYWNGWEHLSGHVYLDGYWQSERYFIDYANQIRHDFEFKRSMDILSEQLVKKIESCNSVSLHVRRGDYASNPLATAVHGLCSPDYYINAINFLHQKIENMELYVFSDDMDWVRANLPLSKYKHTFVSHNKGKSSWCDMKLMSLCRHNIIANSSFSWWGAWLNANTEKIVVRPEKWFAKDDIDTRDLTPKNWLHM